MEILIGIVLYFGFAVFVGRFLSLSSAGEMSFPAAASEPRSPLYEPLQTSNLKPAERRDRAPAAAREEEKEELVLR